MPLPLGIKCIVLHDRRLQASPLSAGGPHWPSSPAPVSPASSWSRSLRQHKDLGLLLRAFSSSYPPGNAASEALWHLLRTPWAERNSPCCYPGPPTYTEESSEAGNPNEITRQPGGGDLGDEERLPIRKSSNLVGAGQERRGGGQQGIDCRPPGPFSAKSWGVGMGFWKELPESDVVRSEC